VRSKGASMPEQKTLERARKDARQGKSPSTQAGEFVREEMEHIRQGKHGARSPQQAIAIGLSKARRAGVKLRPPARGKASARTHEQAERDYQKGQSPGKRKPSARRSRAVRDALKREGKSAASAPRSGGATERRGQGGPHKGRSGSPVGGAKGCPNPLAPARTGASGKLRPHLARFRRVRPIPKAVRG
jgi:hypothetical protein